MKNLSKKQKEHQEEVGRSLGRSGEKFSKENIKSVRPSFGMHPRYFKKIIGKQSTCNLKKGDRLTKDVIKDFNF